MHNRKPPHRRVPPWRLAILVAVLMVTSFVYWRSDTTGLPVAPPALIPTPHTTGNFLGIDSTQTFTAAEAQKLARENYGNATLPVSTAITKITYRFQSELPSGKPITLHARAYLPDAPRSNLPIFAFATGTTGIGDQCSPSLEQPHKANWANYDSHMAMYASQGFAAVTPDYEGMRDPERIHHYMVGDLEGRALLDSIRALKYLPAAKNRLNDSGVFLGGYSQGGHAAFWADKIAASYAPEIRPLGVVGFGPVMSVRQTLVDVTHGANINWFGPYVIYSYSDYYNKNYGPVLLDHWQQTLGTDVPSHCIDTDLPFWGYTPTNVYTPEFIQAMAGNTLPEQYLDLVHDLDINEVGAISTSSAKRINQGAHDNVVLPSQQTAALPTLCQSSKGPVQLITYPNATHYTTMVQSLGDTLSWMRTILTGGKVTGNCPTS